MRLKAITTEQEYDQALARLEEIFDARKGTEEGEELELLGYLIEKYEDEHFPIGFPLPEETQTRPHLNPKINAKISDKVGNYANDPYFVKKADESKAFLEKHGFPEEYLKRRGKV